MGFFSSEMEAMAEIYQRETIELMTEYENCLVQAERRGTLTEDDLSRMFRVVHTIKGSSAMMGLEALSSCTHRMEDLFLLFREAPERISGREDQIFDLLYAYQDYVNGETVRISDRDFQPAAADELQKQVQTELAAFQSSRTETSVEKSDEQAGIGYIWRVFFKEHCQMENVRAFMLLKQIRPLCTSVSTIPSDLERSDAGEQIRREGFLLTILTDAPEEVAKRLSASPYVERLEDVEQNIPKEANRAPGEIELSERGARFSTIPWEQVLKLQELTGELITAHSLMQTALEKLPEYRTLEGHLLAIQRLLRELEEVANAESLMPVSGVAGQYYRIVHEICRKEGKQVDFQIRGEELEVDRTLLDSMSSPLLHLLRNAVDHGIEAPAQRLAAGKSEVGQVLLSVESMGSLLRFIVSDDGTGIPEQQILEQAQQKKLLTKPAEEYSREEILELIFLPGLSTAREVSRYSGRGVGMDVVWSTVGRLGGRVQVQSEPGQGSTFIMEVPVSMTSRECICFRVRDYQCLLPIRDVEAICSWQEGEPLLRTLDGRLWMERNGLLPVIDLRALYAPAEAEQNETAREAWFVVIQGIRQQAVLMTDEVQGEQIAVEKPLPGVLEKCCRVKLGISGCTMIGDGSQGLVLSAEGLIRLAQEGGVHHV